MAKPLVSNDPNPKDVRFSHFGVLDDGKRSKGAAITSIAINLSILFLILIIGAIVKTNPEMQKKLVALTLEPKPVQPKPKPPPKPPPPPPKPLPEVPKIEPPKIVNLPKPIQPPPDIKPMPVPAPKPVQLNSPAPKAVVAVAAPKVVNLNQPPRAASIANNDAHPSAVRLGNPEIKSLNGPPVASPVNLAGGMHGMPPSNTGNGPRATSVHLGNGSPTGSSVGRGAVAPVRGLSHGVPGGTGTGVNGPRVVEMGVRPAAPVAQQPVVRAASMAKPPVVTFLPKPVFTSQATAAHIHGDVSVNVTFHANGTIAIGSVVRGLGYGLDEEAKRVAAGARFKPALDTNGHPIDFPTVLTVHFLTND